MKNIWAQRWPGSGKVAPAIAALIVNFLIGYALIMGLRIGPLWRAIKDDAPLTLLNLAAPAEIEPERPKTEKPLEAQPAGGSTAAPQVQPRRVIEQSAIVAPPPVVSLPAPALPAPAVSPEAANGVGSGDGGRGSGSGRGDGNGDGNGTGDGGDFSRARQTDGRFRNSDFPDWLRGVGRLKIGVRYAIGPSGRIDKCEIIEGSGYAEVDAMTCRIIRERYRFRPARDPEGYAVTEVREEDYRWRVR
ncbi:Gram-negative bacterial tonB protein [Sphingobium herbicidovorans NBRC 16415]|uniref:Gram-negative bacterial tonB protein n=1 Tax=Sphingobium herbicidovorans (strain ATCC 700291 / DSM 11019 / CCUG 56400 / KCTC 2939 / LMG 18315 / NBRC 16415 / MH) TaxID=1219045 RepID=A0A086PAV6_SPHHM|nr:energy transducer TonB [Sphingobium herbicidovorans]KFG90524.1 Gram-negative bacterial tonB protein [Sphingobium herbicidovorans NBRC 16415]